MLPTPYESSFMMSLGGQQNAAGWSVVGRGRLTVPDATYGRSARTMLLVTWDDASPAVHRLLGQRFRSERLGDVEVGAAPLRLEHPAVAVEVPGVPAGRWSARMTAYASDPQGFVTGANEEHFAAIVTLWIRLTRSEAPESPAVSGGGSLTLYVNELGFALCDAPRVDRILAARRDEIGRAGGILEAIGSASVGEELLDDGAFFPMWGMRPWVYRIATPGLEPTLCPVGREVASPLTFRSAGFASGIRVIPGACLQGASQIDWDRWPSLELPGSGDGLQIGSFVSGGPEPIDPDHVVGIVPTVWLARTPEVPGTANSAQYTLTGYNPLESYPEVDDQERVALAGPA